MERDELHHSMLVYLYDPEPGLAAEIEDVLTALQHTVEALLVQLRSWTMASYEQLVDNLGNIQHIENRLEIARADRTFYNDVWAKIKAQAATKKPVTVKITGVTDMKAVYDELERRGVSVGIFTRWEADNRLFEFLLRAGQIPASVTRLQWLQDRGWRDISVKYQA